MSTFYPQNYALKEWIKSKQRDRIQIIHHTTIMASPQLGNGFMQLACEIIDALAAIRISGEARQVLDVIFRKTYGYKKKEDAIALSQFSLATGMSKTRVCQAIAKLEAMKLITKKGNDIANIYGFNKDFDTWKPLPKKVMITKKGKKRYQKQKKALPKTGHTKDNINIKEIAATSAAPAEFKWEEYLEGMENHPTRRDLHVIGFYFREKKLIFHTRPQAEIAIRRHLRAAKSAREFSDKQIVEACEIAKRDYKDLFTIETIVKILTR